MSYAHIGEIKEVSELTQANKLIEAGAELVAILPGWTSDSTPCTLYYLGVPKVKKNPLDNFNLGAHAKQP